MWIRRNDQEIRQLLAEKENKKRSLKAPLFAGFGASVFAMIVYYLGYRGGSLRLGFAYSSAVGFTLRTVGAGIFVGLFTFFLSLYYQRRNGTLAMTNDHLRRCGSCKEISPVNPEMLCQCGGNLEPSEFFTWDDEEPGIATA